MSKQGPSEQPTVATAPEVPANQGEYLKKIQAKIVPNGAFVRMMQWTIGIFGLYSMAQLLLSFSGNPLMNAVGYLIFGTSTSSGIPVSIAKAFLPTFMAPLAVYFAIGVPLLLLAYQVGYQYLNEDRFTPKPSKEAFLRDRAKEHPEVKKTADEAHNPDNDKTNQKGQAQSAHPEKRTPKKATAELVEKRTPIKATTKTAPAPAAKKAATKQKGSAAPIVSAFANQQRQTRLQKAAKENEVAASKVVASKQRVTKK